MKTNRLFLIAALCVGVAMSSCSKEQSELNLSNIEGSATIYGQVKYNQGTMIDDSGVVYENYYMPLAEQEIYIDLELSNFSTSSASGVERYTTKTDAEGNYSFTIPVGQNPISDYIDVFPFSGSYGVYINGAYCTYEDAIYQSPSSSSFTVSNGDMKLVNVVLSGTPVFAEESIDRPVKVKGTVLKMVEEKTYNGYDVSGLITSTTIFAGAEASVTLACPSVDNRTITYKVSVGNIGTYEDDILFYDSWNYSGLQLTLWVADIETTSSGINSFTHYYIRTGSTTASPQTLGGVYSMVGSAQTKTVSYDAMSETVCEFSDVTMTFTPEDLLSVLGIDRSSTDYDYNNPMGW